MNIEERVSQAALRLNDKTFSITTRYNEDIYYNGKTFNTIGSALVEAFTEGAKWIMKDGESEKIK